MKFLLVFQFLFFFFINVGFSQKYPIPANHSVHKNSDDKESRLDADFDGDGIKDLLVVCTKKNNDSDNNLIVLYLSTNSKKYVSFLFPTALGYGIEKTKDVLQIGACFGNGRFCKTLKFRYNKKFKKMQLIGYDEESFGNAAKEGAYKKTVNLSTNQYNIEKYKWSEKKQDVEIFFKKTEKTNIEVTFFETTDNKKLESLEKIGGKYLE